MIGQEKPLVYVMAGGTGGHVIPALAVARGLAEKGYAIRWLGTTAGIEVRLVPEAGIPIDWLKIGGLRGKNLLTRLLTPWRLIRAVFVARKYFARNKPALVLGLGGYAAGPGGLAARWLGIPLVIHEQNAIAGLTNRVLARIANQTLAAYLTAFPHPPHNFTVVGNPVRPEIVGMPGVAQRQIGQRGPVRVLVLGGSLGAKALNDTVPSALSRVSQQVPIAVWHQTGAKNLESTRTNYTQCKWAEGSEYRVVPFIDDMAQAYAWADFVIARAGALTVAEISVAGIGALFVPFPHAVDDHQTYNAESLVQSGAALLMQQRDMTVERLVDSLVPVLGDPDRLQEMAQAARDRALPKATETAVRICIETMNNKAAAND
ncbi:MAG: undecaprenyldiphospho-muramoylpentapeptide beta-N-acetylglucosaminyltransferase [Halothiobacillus sp. 15-55-196]|jgi:UDP-N-acetylglucosamine--N-acetylmuramyl-(pentapeptide) pyrophosphoryl-undecaprenol N-acetylglucosamine transferase|uniref:undecaprenyldiphospho-muramoylpentapeptide beta-N-acetylglucosaminyltransferase n=1 Tax=Halothiobacillus sp. 15-55-196 TaxID=1970382 RepID=UPI000BCDFF6B|nr:undecaprenyldiphospho-muramoylpentapeptide beta-N-acetylglucosaminyltransferase [Halothiobacillus sp. 15-55-196]OZB37630.1 MAG: undecaprenyldiphospho-muramoylpentapeptide beta-N-acetylglucosaminyltransferase [Halothiobacillus sp. 15-55-196]